MYTPDDFPGADAVPWQLLIRARFAHELDAVLASMVVRRLGPLLSRDKVHALATAAAAPHPSASEPVSAEQRVAVLTAVADWDGELCPRWWFGPRPPRPKYLGDLDDAVLPMALESTLGLLDRSASGALQEQLGSLLKQF